MILVQHLDNVVNDRLKVIADFCYFKIYDHALVITIEKIIIIGMNITVLL